MPLPLTAAIEIRPLTSRREASTPQNWALSSSERKPRSRKPSRSWGRSHASVRHHCSFESPTPSLPPVLHLARPARRPDQQTISISAAVTVVPVRDACTLGGQPPAPDTIQLARLVHD